MDIKEHLPESVAELELLGSKISQTLLEERPSLSPRYEFIKHQLLPFFVSSDRIEALTQHLMHPVFCPTLPPTLLTVEQCATYILEVQWQHLLKEFLLILYFDQQK